MKKNQAERFYYEIGTLLATGFPLLTALDFMERPFAADAARLKEKLVQGQLLSDSMMSLPGIDPGDTEILRMAEETGHMAQAFLELHEMRRNNRELRQKLISFAIYPLIMLILILAYLMFSLFFMVPMMTQLLSSLGVQEGFLFTLEKLRVMLSTHRLLFSFSGVILIIGAAFLFRKQHGALRLVLGRRYGLYYEVMAVDRMTKLLRGGRGILEVLEIAGDMTGIRTEPIRSALLSGDSLANSLARGGFSRELTGLTRIHEEGGDLVAGFSLYLASSRKIIHSTMESRIKLLEPLSMVVIGFVVGLTVISIMGPLMDAFGRIQ